MNEVRAYNALGLALGVVPGALARSLAYADDDNLLNNGEDFWLGNGFTPSEVSGLYAPDFAKRLERLDQSCQKAAIRPLLAGDVDFPRLWANGAPLPPLLFVKGRWPLPQNANLAIVGTRGASAYGLKVADSTARLAASHGFGVISGAALGIDSAAHRGALAAGGISIAVMGCGLLHAYPPENAGLLDELAESGALLSQFPPDTHPSRLTFPVRNAIIAALSSKVLVVEGEMNSGARYTARYAKDYGRELFAVPGDIDRPGSALPNSLLANGARPLCRPDDILELKLRQGELFAVKDGKKLRGKSIIAEPEASSAVSRPTPDGLSATAEAIWKRLGGKTCGVDELLGSIDENPTAINAALLELELGGWIVQEAGRNYRPL